MKALAAAGAVIVAGDLAVPASIDDAMAGVSAVMLVSPAVPAQELNVVASAARAGVGARREGDQQGIGRLADRPPARPGRDRGRAGRRRASPHTLLRSNAYMQNVLALAPAIAASSSFGSAAGNGRVGHGRRPRRRRRRRGDRRCSRLARREDLLADRPGTCYPTTTWPRS